MHYSQAKPNAERKSAAISTSITLPQDLFVKIVEVAEAKTQTRSAVITRLCRAGLSLEQGAA